MKKIRIAETATPASKAADKTSMTCMRKRQFHLDMEKHGKHETQNNETTEFQKQKQKRGVRQERGKKGKRTIVLCPPRKVTSANDIIENESDDRPGDVVDGAGRGNETGAAEDDGEVDVFDERVGPFEVHEPSDDGANGADEEEEEEWAVSDMGDVRVE